MELHGAAGGLDLLVGHVGVGQGKVLPDRGVEEVDLLGDHPEEAPGFVGGEAP